MIEKIKDRRSVLICHHVPAATNCFFTVFIDIVTLYGGLLLLLPQTILFSILSASPFMSSHNQWFLMVIDISNLVVRLIAASSNSRMTNCR